MSYRVEKHGELIPSDTRTTISTRYKAITKAINAEFWDSRSDSAHSFYVGSYGRGTAIDTSDVDILVELPEDEYNRHNVYKGNGQSRLLQAVRESILNTYPRSDVRADGQVVKIAFSDGMKFEILPAFVTYGWNGIIYKYPDTNMGGNWRSTNPKAEQDAIRDKNKSSNGLLFDTCKHMRYIRDNYFKSYHLSGIVIDSFVYAAIKNWRWTPPEESSSAAEPGEYEKILYDYYYNNLRYSTTINAPGSNDYVDIKSSKDCLEKVLLKMCE